MGTDAESRPNPVDAVKDEDSMEIDGNLGNWCQAPYFCKPARRNSI